VFEVDVDPAQWTMLRARLERIIKPEHDSLRFYYLGTGGKHRIEHIGAKPSRDLDGPLVI
jgi:CRISPR-associated protein Cas2